MKSKVKREIDCLKNNIKTNEENFLKEIFDLKNNFKELELKQKIKEKKSFNIINTVK